MPYHTPNSPRSNLTNTEVEEAAGKEIKNQIKMFQGIKEETYKQMHKMSKGLKEDYNTKMTTPERVRKCEKKASRDR